jgi:hypothetical protein
MLPNQLTLGVVDMFRPFARRSPNASLLSRNIREAYPGYEFDVLETENSLNNFSAPADEGWFLILMPGRFAQSRMLYGPHATATNHSEMTTLVQGDMIHLPPGASAEVSGQEALFWRFRIKGSPDDFIYKPGITKLIDCTNTKGGCNTGSSTFNPKRDWRRMLYSSQDKENPMPEGFKPKIELHVPLINAVSSNPHWHPHKSKKDGLPQHEFYLMLDHDAYGLEVDNSPSKLMIYPGPNPALGKFQEFEARPGDSWSIFTQTGHQLHGGLVIVAALPAQFDLENEIPVAE